MTTPLINRLNILTKQLLWLNSLLLKTIESMPDSIEETFRASINHEIGIIKTKLNYIHDDINKLMSRCYTKHLDMVKMHCEVETKYTNNKNSPSEKNKLLDKLTENSDII